MREHREVILLKTDKIDFDEVLKEMQSRKNMYADVVLMLDYADMKGQKVAVCKHTPGHIGRYHTHEFFEINYVQKGNCINLVEDDNMQTVFKKHEKEL